jgi:chromosome segregation ATPase
VIDRLDAECNSQKEKYEQHLSSLNAQFELEKASIEQQIASATQRAESSERIIRQLERHHDNQLNEVIGDIQTIRKSSEAKGQNVSEEEIRKLVRQNQKLGEECSNAEMQVRMIDKEIEEIEQENAGLRRESEVLERRLRGMFS